ncbi:DUF4231 domain-containing protein [Hymenobacter ruricola]|uniref:DUF4231 domain-containing protein n=1 Tax=Hymenobacter ruricola TaxID=2791023 RepID=A0ABS0I6T8_9BACT|nr:DUF4231 domain-containing protein [Hymenobacter ruricola]MBF9222686.1 DUF4231 domain-containing protein [Hymenobacter ruricola]
MNKSTIAFGPRLSTVLRTSEGEDLPAIADQLGLPAYDAVMAVIGGANSLDPDLLPRLGLLFERGVAHAALGARAVLVDGGTQSGVMALLGEAVAVLAHRTPLVGVAPASLVGYPQAPAGGAVAEPNHSHFVLTPGTHWGDETPTLLGLVHELAGRGGQPRPAVVLLVGGGPVARTEVVQAVRLGLPIVVLTGSGGLADQLATAWAARAELADDPAWAEILTEGRLRFYPLKKSVEGLENALLRELGNDPVLLQAWETFADYDHNANRQQVKFDRLQRAIIWLGIAGTALALVQQMYAPKIGLGALWQTRQYQWWGLYQVLLLVPITLTLLVTVANQFKQGNKWLQLRAGAEAVKREIYRYRARAMYYAEGAAANPPGELAQRVMDITSHTMSTEVNTSSLVPYDKRQGFPPYSGPHDDGLGYLSPARYVEVRLDDQLGYFRGKAVQLERQLKALSWATFLIGALGTYLAAIGMQIWIALTTAVVAGIGTYLGYRQVGTNLGKYNLAATNLANVRAWWLALPPEDRSTAASADTLVEKTEQVLQIDLEGWVQHMQNALAELHKNQNAAREREEAKVAALVARREKQLAASGEEEGAAGGPADPLFLYGAKLPPVAGDDAPGGPRILEDENPDDELGEEADEAGPQRSRAAASKAPVAEEEEEEALG